MDFNKENRQCTMLKTDKIKSGMSCFRAIAKDMFYWNKNFLSSCHGTGRKCLKFTNPNILIISLVLYSHSGAIFFCEKYFYVLSCMSRWTYKSTCQVCFSVYYQKNIHKNGRNISQTHTEKIINVPYIYICIFEVVPCPMI